MFFQPTVGTGGYLGWQVLQRTEETQRQTFEKSPVLERDIDYFRENIGNAKTAKDLVNDRRLLTVALGAFGLGDEIDKRAFIEKILTEGTETQDAFANRLNDPRFQALAKAFSYGNAEGPAISAEAVIAQQPAEPEETSSEPPLTQAEITARYTLDANGQTPPDPEISDVIDRYTLDENGETPADTVDPEIAAAIARYSTDPAIAAAQAEKDAEAAKAAEEAANAEPEKTPEELALEFREDIIARYKSLDFERAVGQTDNDMRLALNFRREIAEIADAGENTTDATLWFRIMGNQPLREVLTTALNLPSEVSALDVDRQQEIFADKASVVFGDDSPRVFADSEKIDDAIRRFFFTRQLSAGPSPTTPGFGALTLLQSGLGAGASQNLFLSQGF